MGRLLASLLANTESAPAANPANPANLTPSSGPKFADSQDSQGPAIEKTLDQRTHLLTLAADELLLVGLVHALDDADVTACAGVPDTALRAYLRALDCGRRMDSGMAPVEWGEPVARTCNGCGPVLLWSSCPQTVAACPWCFRRRAGKAIPRPKGWHR